MRPATGVRVAAGDVVRVGPDHDGSGRDDSRSPLQSTGSSPFSKREFTIFEPGSDVYGSAPEITDPPRVTVGSGEKESRADTCTGDESADAYRAAFVFDAALPETVVAREAGGVEDRVTVARNPAGER